jgi:hypothetical protein
LRVPDAVQRFFGGAPLSQDHDAAMDPGSAAHHHSVSKTRVSALTVLRSVRESGRNYVAMKAASA